MVISEQQELSSGKQLAQAVQAGTGRQGPRPAVQENVIN
jgi:hypothetical protein